MSKRKILIFISVILALAVVAWSSGDAFAQNRGAKPEPGKEITMNDIAAYFGKVTPAEQKAAAERAKQLGLKPGVAGITSQTPAAPPAAQAPEPGGAR